VEGPGEEMVQSPGDRSRGAIYQTYFSYRRFVSQISIKRQHSSLNS